MPQAHRDWGVSWAKLVNPPPGNDPLPDVLYKNVRMHTDKWDGEYIARGERGGVEYVLRMLGAWQDRSWATCYSLPNEPECNTPIGIINLRNFSIGAMYEASAHGIRVIALEWPEGNPNDDGTGDDGVAREKVRAFAPVAMEAVALGHFIGWHLYWRPGAEGPLDRWHALGRRDADIETWRQAGVPVDRLRVLVTECGIDGGIAPNSPHYARKKGWLHYVEQGLLAPEQYFQQVAEFERAARERPWLVAAFLFGFGPESEWVTFGLDEGATRSIIDAIRALGSPPHNPIGDIESEIRLAAWNALEIAHNPGAAFPQYAREHMLGRPVTSEQDIAGYRFQGYALGIVFARIGDWPNTTHMGW